ncbi:MAG TPA: dihydroorotase [Candidatus Limnocylindrales bacterium]|nr:dihydroorotase [Candidatus Limnocylindrales bacterium]
MARVGRRVARFELEDAWLVDPVAGREGRAALLVEDGTIAAVDWRRGSSVPALLVLPGLFDLHAHLRQPGGEDAESVASGLAAAAHGGFTTVCQMANTEPAVADAAAVHEAYRLAQASGSPVRLLAWGATTAGRAGSGLAPMAALAEAGAIGVSDDGSPLDDPALLRQALLYAGSLGLVVTEHAEDRALTAGAEADEGLAATILGLRGWPAAAEVGAVARALAVLDEVVREAPRGCRPRLHLTHLSTAGAVAAVRAAKAAGLPVTADVTPHHLALTDGWLGGDRRFAWQVGGRPWSGEPAEAPPYDTACRVNPPLRGADDAAALAAGLADGTIDAIATDHAPHREVDKAVEFGAAANGISGLETALGLVLAAVEAGVLELAVAARALAMGGAAVLGRELPGPREGVPADLVVVDRAADWTVTEAALRSRGRNTPLLGRRLPGRVLATLAGGRFAYLDAELEAELEAGRARGDGAPARSRR